MADNEIIKALECCESGYCDMGNCPYRHIDEINECTAQMARAALDLINRQKAEIERLKADAEMAEGYADALEERAKAEAIKEFAERLKEYVGDDLYFEIETNAFLVLIDKLIYEMVGDDNG